MRKRCCRRIERSLAHQCFPLPLGEACPEPSRRSQGEGFYMRNRADHPRRRALRLPRRPSANCVALLLPPLLASLSSSSFFSRHFVLLTPYEDLIARRCQVIPDQNPKLENPKQTERLKSELRNPNFET